ncbi:delta-9 fatty acid desaturase [Dactylonectria macrodidyma]|uniref:Delta-9 fatty acid desaturase n=1 Tax=Dactylonectria macrodidyma TaxID=307937 RepID=A0A9P9EWW9_9HYPO|nr:delta-9 fatty acid desaturase [Dactylonectria macrodidyma]
MCSIYPIPKASKLNTTLIIIIPIIGLISAYWAHTSYKATTPLKIYLAAASTSADPYSGRTDITNLNEDPICVIFIAFLSGFIYGYYNFYYKFPSDYRNAIKYLAYNLKQFCQNEIEKGHIYTPLEQLPNGKALIAITNYPSSKALISSAISKDATTIFNSSVYNYSNAAYNLLLTMCIGVLRGSCEVKIWNNSAG